MTRQDVREIVAAELTKVQLSIGCDWPDITDETRPIGDLLKFDSPVAEDTTAAILGQLGAPADTESPFTKREGGRFLRFGPIVDHFCRAAGLEEG